MLIVSKILRWHSVGIGHHEFTPSTKKKYSSTQYKAARVKKNIFYRTCNTNIVQYKHMLQITNIVQYKHSAIQTYVTNIVQYKPPRALYSRQT